MKSLFSLFTSFDVLNNASFNLFWLNIFNFLKFPISLHFTRTLLSNIHTKIDSYTKAKHYILSYLLLFIKFSTYSTKFHFIIKYLSQAVFHFLLNDDLHKLKIRWLFCLKAEKLFWLPNFDVDLIFVKLVAFSQLKDFLVALFFLQRTIACNGIIWHKDIFSQ